MKPQKSKTVDKENEFFKEFQKVSASHDAAATMQILLHWLDYSDLTDSPGNLARFIELADDSELAMQIDALETTLYAREKNPQWSGDKLYSAVKRARNKLEQQIPSKVQHSLPPLNP